MTESIVLPSPPMPNAASGYSGKAAKSEQYLAPAQVDRNWIYAAGAIASTLSDMSRWHQALIDGRVVSATNYQQMITKSQLKSGKTVDYGLGFDIYPIAGKATYSHQGSVPGFMAWAVYFPADDLYAVAFSNNDQLHPGPALLDLIAIHLQLSPPVVAGPISAEVAAKFVGQYQLSDSDIRTIRYADGTLFSSVNNGAQSRLQLRQQDTLSHDCSENYFQLTEIDGRTALVPISLYHGAGKPQFRIVH